MLKLFNAPCVVEDAPYREAIGHCSHLACARFLAGDKGAISGGGADRTLMRWNLVAAPPHEPGGAGGAGGDGPEGGVRLGGGGAGRLSCSRSGRDVSALISTTVNWHRVPCNDRLARKSLLPAAALKVPVRSGCGCICQTSSGCTVSHAVMKLAHGSSTAPPRSSGAC